MITGFPQVPSTTQAHPVKSQIRKVAFVKSSVTAMRTARNATGSFLSAAGAPDPISIARAAAVTPVQDVAGAVTVVGVTWPRGATSAKDEYQIRTLKGRTWSEWEPFDTDPADAPDSAEAANATGGTSPYLVTGASKYEVRALITDRTTPLAANAPTTATLQVVDPGTSSADSVQPVPAAASAATARPTINPRAAWGANESLRRGAPSYGKVMLGFVHHTVSTNSYTADQVPALIRGMYAYHVQSLGWSDIGYNFLVDRFGRIWEGRYGGMDKAVVGAQTLNFNAVSMGVSAIGNFDVGEAPQPMTDAVERIFAWKFSLAGIPATGTVLANGKYLPRVSGHRDAFATVCPGRYLYARLPEIRTGAAAIIGAPKPAPAPAPVPAPVPGPLPPPLSPAPVPPASPPASTPAPAPPTAATPWVTTSYTPYKLVVLRQHSRGASVRLLQRALKVSADGIFGPGTRIAVAAFQARQHLTANGIVGLKVWNRLELRDFPLVAYRRVTLRQGSQGAAVVAVQRALKLTADGIFGPVTAVTVGVVQYRAKLARTGVVSGWTWVALESWMRR